MNLRTEKSSGVLNQIRMIKAAVQRLAIDVPLARMVGPVTERLEHFGQKSSPRGPHALTAAAHAGHGVAANLLSVVAGKQRPARRPTAGRVIKLSEPQAVSREGIQIGRLD